MNENEENQGQGSANEQKDGGVTQTAKKTADTAKKTVDTAKKAKKAAQTIKNLSMAGPLLHILLYVVIGLVILIILVGIIMFITTMPGMVMEKLKELARNIGNSIACWFGADATKVNVSNDDIYQVMDYLEDMGYDLKGYGFLTEFMDEDDATDAENQKLDNGVIRDKETDEIAIAESDFINMYLVSDNYVYTLKNENMTFQNKGEDWHWWNAFQALGGHFLNLFNNEGSRLWGRGLISIYYDTGTIGEVGNFYGEGLFGWEDIKIDASSQTMSIRRGWFANEMQYSLDGWTGRYGMPLEFLLSVHIATQMPDLSYDMATNFDTEIQILLHNQNASATAGYKADKEPAEGVTRVDPTYITYNEMTNIKSEGWSPTDGWTLSKEEALKILRLGIQSPDNCTYTARTYKLESRTDNGDGWIFDADNKAKLENTYTGTSSSAMSYGYKDSEWDELDDSFSGDSGFKVNECMLRTDDSSLEYNSTVREDAVSLGYNPDTATENAYTEEKQKSSSKTYTFYEDESGNHITENEKKDGYELCSKDSIYQQYSAQLRYCKVDKYIYYGIDKKVTERHWYTPVPDSEDNEDVEYTWTTYLYKVYSYSDEDLQNDRQYQCTFLLDYVSRDKNTQELITEGVLNEDGTSKDTTKCSDDYSEDFTKCCENCRKYVKKIMSGLKDANDQGFETYIPYISKVTEHWFRNVYFAIPNSEIDNIDLIQNDEEYEATMKERWTLYERNGDGTYKLYEVEDSGDFKKDSNGNFVEFDGTQKEANEKGIKVAKKPVTVKGSAISGWNQIGNVYTAYEEKNEPTEGAWERIKPDSTDKLEQKLYVKLITNNDIVQVEEGQRGVTNPIIKQIFLNNKYFKYDGSTQTAYVIDNLRKKVQEQYSDYAYGTLTNRIKSKNDDGTVSEYKEDVDINSISVNIPESEEKGAENKDFYAKDYVGTLSLGQNSLSAFSMLENTHTKDADYIYRDFKELIVELGYFDKEDLTETTPEVFAWFIPEISSSGYPRRELDKKENEYGTFAHSKGDYEANIKNTMKYLKSKADALTEPPTGAGNEPEELGALRTINYEGNHDILGRVASLNSTPITRLKNVGAISDIKAASYNFKGTTSTEKGTKTGDLEIDGVGYEVWKQTYSTCTLYSFAFIAQAYTDKPFESFIKTSSGAIINSSSEGQGTNTYWCDDGIIWDSFDKEGIKGKFYKPEESNVGEAVAKALGEGKPVYFYGDLNASAGYHAVVLLGASSSGKVIFYDPGPGCISEFGGASSFPTNLESLLSQHFKHRIFIPDEAPDGVNKTGEMYVGYEGGEAVVSPATGILLDYGTYDGTSPAEGVDPERINVDLKYATAESVDENGNPVTEEKAANEQVVDKVGYAKILVLDQESYQKLENYMKTNKSSEIQNIINETENGTFLNDEGTFLENPKLQEKDELDNWTDEAKNLYGYKEFGELYQKFDLSGYIIYIDGFKCELPNGNKAEEDDEDLAENGNTEEQLGDGTELTLQYFKDNADTYENSLYKPAEKYRLSSIESTNKLNNEEKTKEEARPLMYLQNEDLLFIKEGTVIGRTISDKELLEDPQYRNGKYGTYDEIRGGETDDPEGDNTEVENATTEETLEADEDAQIIGNYIRIVMRDLDDTVVENVEDYLKLDDGSRHEANDWELFYWLPFESGGVDLPGNGPECQGTCSSGETAVGIIQWTVLTSSDMNNIASQFIPGCLEEDSSLCAPLKAYENWSADDFWNDYSSGTKQFQKTLKEICANDRDGFLAIQMEVAKKQYLEPILEDYPWLADRPSCVQGEIMHLKVWGASISWLSSYESSSDEEIILKVRNTIANTSSTAGDATGDETTGRAYNEPQIALEILKGSATLDDVEKWVREQDYTVFNFDFK